MNYYLSRFGVVVGRSFRNERCVVIIHFSQGGGGNTRSKSYF